MWVASQGICLLVGQDANSTKAPIPGPAGRLAGWRLAGQDANGIKAKIDRQAFDGWLARMLTVIGHPIPTERLGGCHFAVGWPGC